MAPKSPSWLSQPLVNNNLINIKIKLIILKINIRFLKNNNSITLNIKKNNHIKNQVFVNWIVNKIT